MNISLTSVLLPGGINFYPDRTKCLDRGHSSREDLHSPRTKPFLCKTDTLGVFMIQGMHAPRKTPSVHSPDYTGYLRHKKPRSQTPTHHLKTRQTHTHTHVHATHDRTHARMWASRRSEHAVRGGVRMQELFRQMHRQAADFFKEGRGGGRRNIDK